GSMTPVLPVAWNPLYGYGFCWSSTLVPEAMFFDVPLIVIEPPNVTAFALDWIVRFGFGLGGFGGLAATAGPAQAASNTSAALIFLMYLKRAQRAQVGYYEVAPAGAADPLPALDAGVVGDVYSNSSSAPKSVSSA